MNWSDLWDALLSLIPPLFVGVLFWIMIRSILRADRTERKVYSKIEAEMRAAAEAKAAKK
jgi:flagellar biosynthesis/type III secretory pathway M-ring protein FliF/YscJ